MIKICLEYVWLDGYEPEPNLRSKIKVIDYQPTSFNLELDDIPEWGFDGSSTKQAEGHLSDCYLKPVRFYTSGRKFNTREPNNQSEIPLIYVLCEVYDKDKKPHQTNERFRLGSEDNDIWIGFEQEYFIRSGHNKPIIGFENNGLIEPQGKYYCGVGGQIHGRFISEEHLNMCLKYGINIEGTNAEVALGQWQYQIFEKGKLKVCDDLWMSRYFLYKICEKYNLQVELHPKPLGNADWNGSGLHTNFSTKRMRETGGQEYFDSIFKTFGSRIKEHIENYGSDNHLRLTGKHETQSIDKFTWGISDRGASIRVPKVVGETWKGYLEDRRPASNADPYKIIKVITESLILSEDLFMTLNNMYKKIDTNDFEKVTSKFGGLLKNEELLKEYMEDSDYKVDEETMNSNQNIDITEINFIGNTTN